MARASKRIQKELEKFQSDSDGLRVEELSPDTWHVGFSGASGTLYEGEEFVLRIKFSQDYPIDSPQVHRLIAQLIIEIPHFLIPGCIPYIRLTRSCPSPHIFQRPYLS